jgi:hypothetical protein
MFLFDGREVERSQAATFVLPVRELTEWQLVDHAALEQYVSDYLARRLRAAVAVAVGGAAAAYLESGSFCD